MPDLQSLTFGLMLGRGVFVALLITAWPLDEIFDHELPDLKTSTTTIAPIEVCLGFSRSGRFGGSITIRKSKWRR